MAWQSAEFSARKHEKLGLHMVPCAANHYATSSAAKEDRRLSRWRISSLMMT